MSDQLLGESNADVSRPLSYSAPLEPTPGGAFAPLLWAVFLGVSWTWVIGMFMPVLLVRDYGAWAWVVFAVPNVVGAAAMGWVLRDAAASERFVTRHATACEAFSVVTVAFHFFFAEWMIRRVGGPGGVGVGFATGAIVGGGLVALAMRGTRSRWAGACVALAVSSVIWNMMYGQRALALPAAEPIAGGEPGLPLAMIAPVFLVGFALNPYLDLTFHRARQATSPGGGRVAFGVGFGLVFCAMIVFTLLYARFLWPAVTGQPVSRVMSFFLLVHLTAQSAFTIGAHVSELPARRRASRDDEARHWAKSRAGVLGLVVLTWAVVAAGHHASTPRTFRGRDLGEVVYWCFLGFYGLVFPGYVWLCALPAKAGPPAGPTRRALAVLAGVVVVAFPMYWMAFIEGRHVWLVPGLLVMLLSRAFVGRAAAGEGVRV